MYKNKIWGVTVASKTIVIYQKAKGSDKVEVYDGIEKTEVDFKFFKQQRTHYFTSEYKFIKKDENLTLEETRAEIMRDNEILKKETNGLIDLSTQGGDTQAALSVFEHFRDKSHVAEKIGLEEGDWIRSATFGAICCAEEYEGRCFKYDFISHYPAIAKSPDFFIPFKLGKEAVVDSPVHKIAIYKCVIGQTDEYKQKLFRWNKKNLYPYDDVIRAQELGFTVTFQSNQPNVYYWDQSECISGDLLFGQFVDYMYALKKKGVPRSKIIFNNLIGKLMAKDIMKVKIHEDDDIDLVRPGRTMLCMYPFDNEHHIVELIKNESIYESHWARIAPFIMSRGRLLTSRAMQPYIKKIVWCHTDGFLTSTQIRIKTGNDLGQIKYEGYCNNGKIKNCTTKSGTLITLDGKEKPI